ncbi:unnamed protein product [Periconia digitata]|uniref:F-box domain-containing protein n=1 Tax=Periconia digitata TaxID=1303443 RepID=A0A9W4XQI5_9PLEO|nr:unnamed protein product [Periconia digitata]
MIVFFQIIISYIGLTFDPRSGSLLNRWRLFHYLSLPFFPFYFVYKMFKIHCHPTLHMANSKAIKLSRAARMKPVAIPCPPRPQQPFISYKTPKTKLMDILVIEEVVLEIVKGLCWQDVVHFSMTSKAVREQIFPPRDLAYRVPKMKSLSCGSYPKSRCYYCDILICHVFISHLSSISSRALESDQFLFCKSLTRAKRLQHEHHHATYCRPHCTSCYHNSITSRADLRLCRCAKRDRRYACTEDLCTRCAAVVVREIGTANTKKTTMTNTLRTRRMNIYRQKARDAGFGVGNAGVECVRCGDALRAGFLWWICSHCGDCCPDSIHPGYIMDTRRVKIEEMEVDCEKGESRKAERKKRRSLLKSLDALGT